MNTQAIKIVFKLTNNQNFKAMINNTDYFNSIAKDWDNREIPTDKIKHILDVANVSKWDKILDIGTGTGVLLPFLASRQNRQGVLFAVDSAPAMLNIALRKNRNLIPHPMFILADIETDTISERFNRIILYCVFPHLHHPIKTLARLYQNNLVSGGSITIAHPTSREAINTIHHNRPVYSSGLIPAEIIASQLENAGISVNYIEDSNDYYIINIIKE